jgi:hypothetical protein
MYNKKAIFYCSIAEIITLTSVSQGVCRAEFTKTILKDTVRRTSKSACTLPEAKKRPPKVFYERHYKKAFKGGAKPEIIMNWTTDWQITGGRGLALHNVMLENRYFAKKMDLNGYYVRYSRANSTNEVGEKRQPSIATNLAMNPSAAGRYDKISATFVDRTDCLFITQTFAFGPLVKDPEPSHLSLDTNKVEVLKSPHYWAAYMYPKTSYVYRKSAYRDKGGPFNSVGIMQDFYFRSSPGSKPGQIYTGQLFVDWDADKLNGAKYDVPTKVIMQQFDAKKTWQKVIANSQTLSSKRNRILPGIFGYDGYVPDNFPLVKYEPSEWRPDNFHQTYNTTVDEPNAFPPGPGCTECVHTHWRWPWFAFSALKGRGLAKEYLGLWSDEDLSTQYKKALKKYSDGVSPGAAILDPASLKMATEANGYRGQDVYVGSYGLEDFKYMGVGRAPSDSFFNHPVFYAPLANGQLPRK